MVYSDFVVCFHAQCTLTHDTTSNINVNYKHSVNVVLIGGSSKNDACVLRMEQEFRELEIPSLAVGGLN